MSRKPSLFVIFLTVFIDLVGFGIVLPLSPIYAKSYGASGFEIGLLMASYSAMQFVFAPAWGRLSDRIGRRPVLLVSTAGAVLSYAVFAFGTHFGGSTGLWIIISSRVFAGICGANITVAQAYIADITPPEQRSRRMGLIGMAFGLGFIFGPGIGWISLKYLGEAGPAWVASGLCLANFILAVIILPESWTPSSEHVARRPRITQWVHTMRTPTVGLLIVIFFLATFCFACFEITLGLVIAQNFHLSIDSPEAAGAEAGKLFMFCGIIGAFIQGGPIGRLVKAAGERKLIAVSLLLTGVSLAPIPFIHGFGKLSWTVLFSGSGGAWWLLLLVLALLSIGSGLTRPPLFGLLSTLTPAHEQGATLGIAQSAGSLARIIGPLFAGAFYEADAALPYLVSAVISVVAGLVAWIYLVRPHAAASR